MFIKVKTLKDFKLDSLDGEIGKVEEFYFDDLHWTIRYLVANTGNWLKDRKVLISPYALTCVLREEKGISISLTKKQIEDSPALSYDQPVSHQFEGDYYGYYGWPVYWGGPYMWGAYPYYPYLTRDQEKWKDYSQSTKNWDPHLRSTESVTGYHVQASDGEIGHIDDFVIDDETWTIRYLIVSTTNWLPGKKVLISPKWIESISWENAKVVVHASQETIKQAPEYTEETLLTRDYEAGLHRHYSRQGYWIDDQAVVG